MRAVWVIWEEILIECVSHIPFIQCSLHIQMASSLCAAELIATGSLCWSEKVQTASHQLLFYLPPDFKHNSKWQQYCIWWWMIVERFASEKDPEPQHKQGPQKPEFVGVAVYSCSRFGKKIILWHYTDVDGELRSLHFRTLGNPNLDSSF